MKRALKESIGTQLGTHLRTFGLSGLIIVLAIALSLASATAQKKSDPGVTDTEIKIGNIMPYSGPLSAYSVAGRAERPISARSTREAVSMAARSGSSPMTTPIVRQKRSSRRASWSRAMRSS